MTDVESLFSPSILVKNVYKVVKPPFFIFFHSSFDRRCFAALSNVSGPQSVPENGEETALLAR